MLAKHFSEQKKPVGVPLRVVLRRSKQGCLRKFVVVVGTQHLYARRRGIRRGLADFPERVAIGVVDRLRLPWDDQNRALLVGPRSIGMDRNGDGIAHGSERVFEKRIGDDPVRLGTTDRLKAK